MRYPHDVVGGPLAPYPMWGYPGYPGATAFGQGGPDATPDLHPAVVAAAQQGDQQAQAIVQHHMRMYNPYNGACWGPSPQVMPPFVNSMTTQRHAVLVGPQIGPQEFETTMGFEVGPLEAGATKKFRAVAEYPFKINGLYIPSGTPSSAILVNSLVVGVKNQFANNNPIPGLVFQEAATGRIMNGDTVQNQQAAVLEVTNTSNADIPIFAAALRGVGVQGYGAQILGGPQAL